MTTARINEYSEFLNAVLGSLLEDPSSYRVNPLPSPDSKALLEIEVAPDRVGQIIGKDGRTIRAIRTLMLATCRVHGDTCSVTVKGANVEDATEQTSGPVL